MAISKKGTSGSALLDLMVEATKGGGLDHGLEVKSTLPPPRPMTAAERATVARLEKELEEARTFGDLGREISLRESILKLEGRTGGSVTAGTDPHMTRAISLHEIEKALAERGVEWPKGPAEVKDLGKTVLGRERDARGGLVYGAQKGAEGARADSTLDPIAQLEADLAHEALVTSPEFGEF